jgi:hypothetical protein
MLKLNKIESLVKMFREVKLIHHPFMDNDRNKSYYKSLFGLTKWLTQEKIKWSMK